MSLVGTRPPTVTEASEYYIYPVVNAQNANNITYHGSRYWITIRRWN